MPLVIPVFYFYTFGLPLYPFFNKINEQYVFPTFKYIQHTVR
jgi:hypothetical protein